MKGNRVAYLMLGVLTVTDAWLISHPNLLGRFGVWFYRYDYLSTFPRALFTVGLSVALSVGVAEWAQRQLRPAVAQKVLLAGLLVALVFLVGVILKFSGGTYAHTGKAFVWGFHLLPILLAAVFGSALWQNRSRL